MARILKNRVAVLTPSKPWSRIMSEFGKMLRAKDSFNPKTRAASLKGSRNASHLKRRREKKISERSKIINRKK